MATLDRNPQAARFHLAGIAVEIHWTFLVLLGWIFLSHLIAGHGARLALQGVAFAAVVFGCVLLHEFGHAAVARRFGVRTRSITLYPIGGIARFERIPERPSHELWIALAGPAVNFAIAAALWLAMATIPLPAKLTLVGGSFVAKTMYVNLSIGVFNLLPAFPMDGGRVLRALLALSMPYVRATQVAATAGKVLAVLLGLLGLLINPFLLFISLFVFVAAQQEALLVQMRTVLRGVPVSEAMMTRFQTISADTPLSDVVSLLLTTEQEDFPVILDHETVGMLTRAGLLRALASGRRDAPITAFMMPACEPAQASEMLDDAFRRMQDAGCSALPVMRKGEFVGLISLEHIGKWMMVRAAEAAPEGPMHERAAA